MHGNLKLKPVPPPETEAPAVTLRALARSALKSNDGDVPKAIASVVRRLKRDKALLNAVVSEAIDEATYSFVHLDNRKLRARIIAAASNSRNGVISLVNGLRGSFLNFPLPNGMPLGEATPEELTDFITRYEQMGQDCLHKARFLKLIIQDVPEGKKVKDTISDDEASRLWEASNAEG